MDRKKALGYLGSVVNETDALILIGATVCGACSFKESSNVALLLDEQVDYFSIMLGLSMISEKRFFLVCEDRYFLRHFGTILQVAVSKCKNIFIIVMVTEEYSEYDHLPTIYKGIRSMKGVVFNLGILSHDYTAYLKNKSTSKQLSDILKNTIGPVIGLVTISDTKLFSNSIETKLMDI